MARTNTTHIKNMLKEHICPGTGITVGRLAKLSELDESIVRKVALKLQEVQGSGVCVIPHNDWIIRFY